MANQAFIKVRDAAGELVTKIMMIIGLRYTDSHACPHCNVLNWISYFKSDREKSASTVVECFNCHQTFEHVYQWDPRDMQEGHFIEKATRTNRQFTTQQARPASRSPGKIIGICVLCGINVLESFAYVETKKGLAHTECLFGA